MGNQQVSVGTDRRAGIQQQLLERDGALRHATGVLDDQDIASHQLRPGDAGELVVGEVPGLDTEQHADGRAFHVRFANLWVQLSRCQEGLGMLGVIGQDVAAESDLSARLINALAHLQRRQPGEVVNMGVQQCRLV